MKTLHHYCSTQTFQKIISGSSLRLSSMTLSNDSEEGRWSIRMIERACACLLSPNGTELTSAHLKDISFELNSIIADMDGLGICFSTERDMLSQWRGYADDGQGFSLGFRHDRLDEIARKSELSCRLVEVEYDEARAIESFGDIAFALKKHAMDGAFDLPKISTFYADAGNITQEAMLGMKLARGEYVATTHGLIVDELFRFKNPAFKEEKEWRLLNSFYSNLSPIFPTGAEFDAKSDILKPFKTLRMGHDFKEALTHVMLGPKNKTPEKLVRAFLTDHGFMNVEVKKSDASYQ